MDKKMNKTISVKEKTYNEFKMYCVRKGKSVSGLIQEYMDFIVDKNKKELTRELVEGYEDEHKI